MTQLKSIAKLTLNLKDLGITNSIFKLIKGVDSTPKETINVWARTLLNYAFK